MTTEEFNEKYKDYLEEGHYGLAINNANIIDYLDKKFQEFIKIPGFHYSQIKLKFGYPRFYCGNISIDEIRKVEDEILKLCKL